MYRLLLIAPSAIITKHTNFRLANTWTNHAIRSKLRFMVDANSIICLFSSSNIIQLMLDAQKSMGVKVLVIEGHSLFDTHSIRNFLPANAERLLFAAIFVQYAVSRSSFVGTLLRTFLQTQASSYNFYSLSMIDIGQTAMTWYMNSIRSTIKTHHRIEATIFYS